MATEDREQQFERALARHLRDACGETCPDAEVLAAYHERALSLEEMAKWKEHIAACERCQEALVLVEQADTADAAEWQEHNAQSVLPHAAAQLMAGRAVAAGPTELGEPAVRGAAEGAVQEVVRLRPARAQWKWLVPIGAVAAGVMVWIGSEEIRKQHEQSPAVQMAENRGEPKPLPAPQTIAPPTDAKEQKLEETDKARRNDSADQLAATNAPAKIAGGKPTTVLVPPPAAADRSAQSNPNRDLAAEGHGSGSGLAPPAAKPNEPERRKNEMALAEERNAAISGALSPPAAPAKQLPAPAPTPALSDRGRETMAYRSVDVMGGNLSAITGTVIDPSGAGIRGAVITATDTSSGKTKSAVADATGQFQLTELPSDRYRVVVAQTGFASSEQTVTLEPQQNKQLQVQLKLGAVSQSVGVATTLPASNVEVSKDADGSTAELSAQARNLSALMQLAAGNLQYIVAPEEKVGWRVGEGGKIERSADHGKTWTPQTSGVSVDLRTGSATSSKVCWVVGKTGTILLTTDGGKHWKQIASPIPEDLGRIHALDALHATVWDAPNRQSYETTDGGLTWKRVASE